MGKTPVGRGNSPVRDEIMLDTAVSEGRMPVGRGNSPVSDGTTLDTAAVSEGRMPVGRGSSPVRLLKRESTGREGRMPVGRIPLGPKRPSTLLETGADWVGWGSEAGTLPVEPGMMNGPRIVEGALELGSWVTGEGVGETMDPGMPPLEATSEDWTGTLDETNDSLGTAAEVGTTIDEGTPSVEPTLDWIGGFWAPPVEVTGVWAGSLTAGAAELVGVTISVGMPPVEATLDWAGSLTSGTTALVGWTIDEGTPPVEAMLD